MLSRLPTRRRRPRNLLEIRHRCPRNLLPTRRRCPRNLLPTLRRRPRNLLKFLRRCPRNHRHQPGKSNCGSIFQTKIQRPMQMNFTLGHKYQMWMLWRMTGMKKGCKHLEHQLEKVMMETWNTSLVMKYQTTRILYNLIFQALWQMITWRTSKRYGTTK